MKKTIVVIACASIALISCSGNKHSNDIIISEEINMEHRPLNFETTKIENDAHSGKYYSSVDSIRVFTAGYSFVIPDSLKNKNLTVYFSAWIREKEAPLQGGIILSLTTTKGNVGWNFYDKKDLAYNAGEWVLIKDSVVYPSAKINEAYAEIGVVGMKEKGKDNFDLDDLQIKYKFSK